MNQANRVLAEVKQASRRRRTPVEGLTQALETMVGRVRQVVRQTRIRIFAGDTKSAGKIVSVFEPHTEIIRKGKASKPQRVWQAGQDPGSGNQIVTHFEVYAERPADSTLLLSSIEVHQQRLGRIPRLVAADAGFYSRENEKAGQALGVQWMSAPNKNTESSERKLLQHQRWFRRGQKWRNGSEGRISVLKRRHGLRRCLYPGLDGMRRWVGLGVIADNFIQMGCYLARQST
jgi:IS5 family transposase